MVSPRLKFILITVDELFLVVLAIAVTFFLAPEYLPIVSVVSIGFAVLYVIGKYYVIYPSLADTSTHAYYHLKGIIATVVNPITTTSGKVRVGAELWDARCKDCTEIPVGSEVRIIDRENLRVFVAPTEWDDPS